MLQQIGTSVASAALALLMALWSTRPISPLWPALVFALGRAGISLWTGATSLTALGTGVVALVVGVLYFWLLQRTQGSRLWWLVLFAGTLLLAL